MKRVGVLQGNMGERLLWKGESQGTTLTFDEVGGTFRQVYKEFLEFCIDDKLDR